MFRMAPRSWRPSFTCPALDESMGKSIAVVVVLLGMSCLAVAETAATADALASALPLKAAPAKGFSSVLPALAPDPIAPTSPAAPIASPVTTPSPELPVTHRFFDKKNLAIFASLTAGRTMDPISTWQFRRHGLHESELSDGFVDNKPLFAAYSASLVAAQISTSYLFHRLGWHKLERFSAMVHTGVVTEAVIHNYRIGYTH